MDPMAGGRALISSRVRGLLAGSELVDIGLPTEAEAVRMLLSVGGMRGTSVADVPAEALQVRRFGARG